MNPLRALSNLLTNRIYSPSFKNSATARIPYWNMYDGVVFNRAKTAETAFEFRPPSGIAVTDEERMILSESVRGMLTTALPERCRLRLIVECGELGAVDLLRPEYDLLSENEILAEMETQRKALDDRMRRSGQLRNWRYIAVIRMPEKFRPLANLLNQDPTPFTTDQLDREVREAQRVRQQVMGSFEVAGYDVAPMDSQDAYELMVRWFNPNLAGVPLRPVETEALPPSMARDDLAKRPQAMTGTLREQVTMSDISTSEYTHLVVGTKQVQTMNLRYGGKYTFAGIIEPLTNVMSQFRFWLVIDLKREDQIERRKKMSSQALDALNAATDPGSSIGGQPDISNAAMFQNFAETVGILERDQEQVFTTGLSMVVITDKDDDRIRAAELFASQASQLGGAIPLVGTAQNLTQYLDHLAPFSGTDNAFMSDALSRNAADFAPLVAPYQGSLKPVIVLNSRMGTQIGINPADNTNNSGILVLGQAGSGKTMLTHELLAGYCRINVPMLIIDQKSDYENFVTLVDGQYIDFTPGAMVNALDGSGRKEAICYNAFELPVPYRDENGVLTDGMDDHKMFLMAYLKRLINEPVTGTEGTVLSFALDRMYEVTATREMTHESPNQPTLKTFLENLERLNRIGDRPLTQELKDASNRLQNILIKYIGETPLGRFLDGQSNVHVDNPITVFNISRINDNEQVKAIAMLLLTRIVSKRMTRDTKPKVMLIEELGVLLQTPEAANFVSRIYKIGRTYGLIPIAVSQEPKEFESAPGLLNNMSVVLIGTLVPTEARRVVELFNLDASVENTIMNLGGIKNVSKEYLVLSQTVSRPVMTGSVASLQPTSALYWAASSNPKDRLVRQETIARVGGNRLAAYRILSRSDA